MAKFHRRQFLAGSLACGLAAAPLGPLRAQHSLELHRDFVDLMKPETQDAIERGLEFLASRQTEDGAFQGSRYERNVAVVSLAGTAFMAHGSTPGRGPYGTQVERAVEYILQHTEDDGFIRAAEAVSHGPMYGHGFATLFLAEVYGMTPDSRVRENLVKAVRLIVRSQNAEGGWRYMPHSADADISVTICQVMALRAARNAGVYVPTDTIDRCIEYVKRSQNPDGGFMYRLQGGPSEFARSAAGVVALFGAGIYEGDEIRKGLDYLMQYLPGNHSFGRDTHYFYYGHYYAVQAMWIAGGEYWRQWYPAIHDVLLAQQHSEEGYWFDQICSEYGTAMACMILQMPNNYLPIFQR